MAVLFVRLILHSIALIFGLSFGAIYAFNGEYGKLTAIAAFISTFCALVGLSDSQRKEWEDFTTNGK